MYHWSELDWQIYKNPLDYAEMVFDSDLVGGVRAAEYSILGEKILGNI